MHSQGLGSSLSCPSRCWKCQLSKPFLVPITFPSRNLHGETHSPKKLTTVIIMLCSVHTLAKLFFWTADRLQFEIEIGDRKVPLLSNTVRRRTVVCQTTRRQAWSRPFHQNVSIAGWRVLGCSISLNPSEETLLSQVVFWLRCFNKAKTRQGCGVLDFIRFTIWQSHLMRSSGVQAPITENSVNKQWSSWISGFSDWILP